MIGVTDAVFFILIVCLVSMGYILFKLYQCRVECFRIEGMSKRNDEVCAFRTYMLNQIYRFYCCDFYRELNEEFHSVSYHDMLRSDLPLSVEAFYPNCLYLKLAFRKELLNLN